jgi:uncharacterized protein YceK
MKFIFLLAFVTITTGCATMMSEPHERCDYLKTCEEIKSKELNNWVWGNVITYGLTALVDYGAGTIDRCEKEFNKTCLSEKVCSKQKKCVDSIVNGELFIGMTEKAMLIAWGKPEKVNETVTSRTISKQNIYETKYVYTKNGVITSWQNRTKIK